MVIEIVCIAGQAARGTTSHFNKGSSFDDTVFAIMGLAILFSTLLDVLMLILFFGRHVPLATTYLWGIRCGLFGAILAAGVGVMMLRNGCAFGRWPRWRTRTAGRQLEHRVGRPACVTCPAVARSADSSVGGFCFQLPAQLAHTTRPDGRLRRVYHAVHGAMRRDVLASDPGTAAHRPIFNG